MAWRGSTDIKDRFFGAAVYLFAIYDAMALGSGLSVQVPALLPFFNFLQILVLPITLIYDLFNRVIPFGFGSLIVFFILFIAVVRNEKISYFIRFNTLQSILFGIAISLIAIVFNAVGALALIGGLVFLLGTGASIFCMVQCALGRYPEIPSVSDAVYGQLPR